MANHPLIKDVKKWIVDSFSFMDAIGYDVVFDDEEIKNTNIIVADIDGLTDSDFEKGKKNLLKSIPNKIKAEFPYLRIRSSKDGDYFIMYIVLADNDNYFKTKNIPYVNLNESKKSTRKSIKESSVRCVTFEQIVDSRFDDISKGEKILNDRKDEIIELCGDDFSVYTNKIEFLDWGDDESQYRQKYYIRKNNNDVSWNDLYKIVNSVKAVPYKFDKINDSVFESKKSARKSIKESKIMSYKDFQDVCIEESENDIINFHEYKGAYFVILRTEEECERLLRVLCDKYRFEGTCYKIIDPYNPNYKCYEIMCV